MEKKILSFEAPLELKEALRVAAFQKGLSVSAYIRQVLEREVQYNTEVDN